MPVGQREQEHVAAPAFDEGADGGHALAEDEVALPVAGDGAVVDLGRPLADHHHVAQLALAEAALDVAGPAHRSARAQAGGELTPQGAPALHVQRHVDGLVGHPHLRVVGVVADQPAADLLR